VTDGGEVTRAGGLRADAKGLPGCVSRAASISVAGRHLAPYRRRLGREDPIVRWLSAALAACALVAAASAAAEPPLPSHEPALESNFPDPSLLETKEGHWFAFATNDGVNVPVARLVGDRWLQLMDAGKPRDAMPKVPLWVSGPDSSGRGNEFGDDIWAPEVMWIEGQPGYYVLYFSGRHYSAATPLDRDRTGWKRRQCIGTAVSPRPDGGFVAADEPLICTEYPEGVIDPNVFRDDDGRLFLYYKNDANCCLSADRTQQHTRIYARELDPSGLRFAGEAKDLGLKNDRPWEGPVIEAPTMINHSGQYYLFYSGNWFSDDNYGVGYAKCKGPMGDCADVTTNKALIGTCEKSSPPRYGPGHQDVVSSNGDYFIALHARATPGASGAARRLHIYRMDWKDGAPPPPIPCP
jgi:GH43 family beta-xylosidase